MFLRFYSAFLITLLVLTTSRGADQTGEQIYRKMCASCHGATGEGSKSYKKPLIGDRSVPQLSQLIAKTMPEDDPGSCVGPDADKVSQYIFDTFYSPAAQSRNKPPRVELARLTINQYRNTVADLIGSFRAPGKPSDQQGLTGEYFKSRRFNNNERVIERLDPEVKFDFGIASPVDGKMEAREFSMRWSGSVKATETGVHEFVVRSDQAIRLWVNETNPSRPLIDAWVKSGSDTEFRGAIFLLAGRTYPIRLEFSKAKQGVDDSKNGKQPPPKPAMISLCWKLPLGEVEVIPRRHLTPAKYPELFVPETPFPPDDRSYGWERGTTVSKAWDQSTTDAALETATYIALKSRELIGLRDGANDRVEKTKLFAKKYAERAFRRPITPEQQKFFVDRHFEGVPDADVALRRSLLLIMKSPRFLYREVGDAHNAYDVASKLSYGLWDSSPDEELMKAAGANKLTTREQVAQQAERMMNDPRAKTKLNRFLLKWLKLDQVTEISKDPKRFPEFNHALVSDLRTSLELFLDEVVWGPSSDFRQLLLTNDVYMNGRLAKYYGLPLPAEAPFQKVKLNPELRAGVLTHPYMMANFAYTGTTSPIHRGVFLARGVLGIALRPPPEAFTPLAEDLHPGLTTRERVELQTKPAACQTCHNVINPLGFTLERFDAVGRLRDKDNNKPIVSLGNYQTRKGETKEFNGARELAAFLTQSEEVHSAFAEQLFHDVVKQPMLAYGPKTKEELRNYFVKEGYNIRKLMVEIAVRTSQVAGSTQPPSTSPVKK
jgi:hypothetical protein